MKPLKDTLNESLLDDEDELFDRNYKTLIELWIKENYKIHGTLKIYKDTLGFVVDSNDDVEVTNKDIKSLTNGMFQWGEIIGRFNCDKCKKLTSLKGAPNECDNFYCFECTELRTLEGAPNECVWFKCSGCIKLTSLKGVPSKCDSFNCSKCTELRSLEGVPVGATIKCSDCTNLIITDNELKKYKIKS